MNLKTILCSGLMCCAGLAFGQGGAQVPYPTEHKIVIGPNGKPMLIPTKFGTGKPKVKNSRKELVGTAEQLSDSKQVKLSLSNGSTVTTGVGKQLKLDGQVYQSMGWRGGAWVLKGMKDKKSLFFRRTAKAGQAKAAAPVTVLPAPR